MMKLNFVLFALLTSGEQNLRQAGVADAENLHIGSVDFINSNNMSEFSQVDASIGSVQEIGRRQSTRNQNRSQGLSVGSVGMLDSSSIQRMSNIDASIGSVGTIGKPQSPPYYPGYPPQYPLPYPQQQPIQYYPQQQPPQLYPQQPQYPQQPPIYFHL